MGIKIKPVVKNGEVEFGGINQMFRMQCRMSDMSLESRKAMFSYLLFDPEIVTAPIDSKAHRALRAAVDAACYKGS